MTALVTGGAGFIGSHLVDALLERGARVRVLDDLSSGRRENLDLSTVDLIQGSILDSAAVQDAIAGCDAVFHLAAIASVQRSVEDPLGTGRVNSEGTLIVAEAAAREGAKIVLSSSSAVYGNPARLPVDETFLPETRSPYAAQKLASEAYLLALHATKGLRAVSLRYFNVYGPRQDPNSEYAAVIPKFVTRALGGRPLLIFGDGGQTRDFVYVTDVARANLLAYDSALEAGEVVNIGSGRSLTVLELAQKVRDVTGTGVEILHEPARAGEVRLSSGDVSRAFREIGFRNAVEIEEGLARICAFWKETSAA